MALRNDINVQFIEAAEKGDLEAVKTLLQRGANIDATTQYGDTALHWAAVKGHFNVVTFLLENDASPNVKAMSLYTPLMVAAQKGFIGIVNALLDKGAAIDVQNKEGSTVLLSAACSGNINVVNVLLDKGANINDQNNNNDTVLTLAAWTGHAELVKFFLLNGVNKNIKTKQGKTAMMLAKENGHHNVVNILENFTAPHAQPRKITLSDRLQKIHYDETKVPEYLECPISLTIMTDPITLKNGRTYDRESLRSLFASKGYPDQIACPVTRIMISKAELDNGTTVIIKELAEAFVVAAEKEDEENKKIKEKEKAMSGAIANQSSAASSTSTTPEKTNEKSDIKELREKRMEHFSGLFPARQQIGSAQEAEKQSSLSI